MLRAPYGLPMKITAEQYRANPICQLSAYNYKVNAKVGSTRATQRYLLAVLDTGAGPNLIREGCCSRDALESLDDSREIVNLSSATNHRLDVLGITTLTVTLGDYTARVPFVVVRNLGADILLGCTFIDRHVEGIFPTKRNARLANGCVIPIIRRRALEPVVEQLPEKKILGKRSLSGFNAIRLTEPITIPPHAQTYARVTCNHQGLRLVEMRQELWDKKRVAVASGVSKVKPNVPFLVQIANFSNKAVRLFANERVGISHPVPIPAQKKKSRLLWMKKVNQMVDLILRNWPGHSAKYGTK